MDKEKQTNKKSEEISLHHFLSLVKQMNKNNEHYIIRKKDNLILYLGKIINYEEKCIFERMCWHDGPIYIFLCNFIEFENSNRIDDLELIDKFKNIDEDNKKYIIDNYSNLFIV